MSRKKKVINSCWLPRGDIGMPGAVAFFFMLVYAFKIAAA